MGNKEVKEIVVCLLNGIELGSSLVDGVSFGDVGEFISFAKTVPAAIKDAKLAWEQYKNMTDVEALDIETTIEQEFDIPNDSVEMVIEQVLKVAVELHVLFQLVVKPVPAKG